jgi:hypothetical protein
VMVRPPNSLYCDSFFQNWISFIKKVPYVTGLHFIWLYHILQQSRSPHKKEVKIETVPEICACHFWQLSG